MRAKIALLVVVLIAVMAVPARAHADTHTVSWDKYSLMVDGKRVYVWSGEFHPFRLPNPDLWRDILQKMKANGYDAVSIYVDWAYHSPKPGVYDFSGIRDMDKFLDIANEVGLYVIARPGPYINAEVDAGGYPGWLTTKAGTARSNNATYLSYVDEYLSHIDQIIARHQVTNGTGPVVLYQIENEYAGTNAAYMQHLYNKVRADGITVPIFHNDKGRNGQWTPGSFTDQRRTARAEPLRLRRLPGRHVLHVGQPRHRGHAARLGLLRPRRQDRRLDRVPEHARPDGRVRRRLVRPVGRQAVRRRRLPVPGGARERRLRARLLPDRAGQRDQDPEHLHDVRRDELGLAARAGRLHVLRLRRRLGRGAPAARRQGHGDEGDGLHGAVRRAAVRARRGRHGGGRTRP